MRIWHLLTHTAGLTYRFHHSHPVDRLYREAGFEWASPPGVDLAVACDKKKELWKACVRAADARAPARVKVPRRKGKHSTNGLTGWPHLEKLDT